MEQEEGLPVPCAICCEKGHARCSDDGPANRPRHCSVSGHVGGPAGAQPPPAGGADEGRDRPPCEGAPPSGSRLAPERSVHLGRLVIGLDRTVARGTCLTCSPTA